MEVTNVKHSLSTHERRIGNPVLPWFKKQRDTLRQFEKEMGLGAVAAAQKLDTPYDTYKDWKSGRNKMPGCAYVAIELWMGIS